MKTRLPSVLGVFAAILMVSSFVIPVNIAAPSVVSADPGIMRWDTLIVPESISNYNDIVDYFGTGANTGQGSEVLDVSVGNDGTTVFAVARTSNSGKYYYNKIYRSGNRGQTYSGSRDNDIRRMIKWAPVSGTDRNVFQVVVAPDDPKFVVVSTSKATPTSVGWNSGGPVCLWVSTDTGSNWDLAFDGTTMLVPGETIRRFDVSIDYGGKRDIGFVTTNSAGGGGGRWFVEASTGFTGWLPQLNPDGTAAGLDSNIVYDAIKFSPTYNGDSSVGLVYSTFDGQTPGAGATYFNVAYRDMNQNTTLQYAYGSTGIEVKNPASPAGNSPGAEDLNNACLQLPADFSGQSSSLRRAYISLDAFTFKEPVAPNTEDGIYRIDDTTTYVLMDTTTILSKSIYSIAYFGNYASGKLLAGERMGFSCTATVPTWFTDSPTTCPIPCWYPALKPTTGAASQGACILGAQDGLGGAVVAWNPDGSLGLVITGALPSTVYATVGSEFITGGKVEVPGHATPHTVGVQNWWQQAGAFDARNNGESAYAISRNNGETWNQLSLIDTTLDWFNDVAISPDCTTIYLASVNRNKAIAGMCNEFDSVWRTTVNPNVAAPLPTVPPIGTYWERVWCHVTSGNCNVAQTDLPILRVVESCTDKKDGEIVGWAAEDALAGVSGTGGVLAWSPDFGDYWAVVTPRDPVRDFTFESSTIIYTLSAGALVQRLPYTGTAWSTNLPSYDTTLSIGHTIAAMPDGKVLAGSGIGGAYEASYSSNAGVLFTILALQLSGHGNEHVIFDVDFKNNQFMYMGDDMFGGTLGTVYRNTLPAYTKWVDNDLMAIANGASGIAWPDASDGPPHPVGIFGLVQAWTGASPIGTIPYGPALYAAHDIHDGSYRISGTDDNPVEPVTSEVCRTLVSRAGLPKPGVQWDCLDVFAPINTQGVAFTLEPTSLKYCGCCTLDTNTTLYAIDDQRGWLDPASAPAQLLPVGTDTKRLIAAGDGRYNAGISGAVARGINRSGHGYTPNTYAGFLWAYTDCLAKKGPVLKSPADKFLVGADPVTGRNQQIDLSWEQLCLSSGYELQLAKDQAFTLRIDPSVNYGTGGFGKIAAVTGSIKLDMDSTNMTTPAAWLAPGTLPEAGAIYWWRIRTYKSATQQLAWSPWSDARSFTVKAGFIVTTPYYGVQLLATNNGCVGCKIKPVAFSWSPWKEAAKYQLELANDAEFKQSVLSVVTTSNTGYLYDGTLDYNTNYFWRVKALEVNGQNIPSDWSATFSFQTEPAPAPPAPAPAQPAAPLWVWVIIAIGAILVIVVLILIFKSRRV